MIDLFKAKLPKWQNETQSSIRTEDLQICWWVLYCFYTTTALNKHKLKFRGFVIGEMFLFHFLKHKCNLNKHISGINLFEVRQSNSVASNSTSKYFFFNKKTAKFSKKNHFFIFYWLKNSGMAVCWVSHGRVKSKFFHQTFRIKNRTVELSRWLNICYDRAFFRICIAIL